MRYTTEEKNILIVLLSWLVAIVMILVIEIYECATTSDLCRIRNQRRVDEAEEDDDSTIHWNNLVLVH
jgi:hypothetical protein